MGYTCYWPPPCHVSQEVGAINHTELKPVEHSLVAKSLARGPEANWCEVRGSTVDRGPDVQVVDWAELLKVDNEDSSARRRLGEVRGLGMEPHLLLRQGEHVYLLLLPSILRSL